MKRIREILSRGNEAAFASGLLLLYAMELFLSPDPEWTMWAAQMAMGILYVPDPPSLQEIAQGGSAHVLSTAGAFGCLTSAVLLALWNPILRRRTAWADRKQGR
ncbi:MAG: hypothetical protein ACYDAX_00035 [Desulfobacteria bacterium]|nr:hypothetical protein [Deltaproteobacteria bacterium]